MTTTKQNDNVFGPTPFAAHLLCAMQECIGSRAALDHALKCPDIWHQTLKEHGEQLVNDIRAAGVDQVARLISELACERLEAFLSGVESYQNFERTAPCPSCDCVAQEGNAHLLKYQNKDGTPVIFIPSLVNPAHILDLSEERSLMRHLATQGLSVYLIDWGTPDTEEKSFCIEDYVSKRLIPLIETLGRPVILVGYCMGGNLALAAAHLRPDLITHLALLATPWDFHADGDGAAKTVTFFANSFRPVIEAKGALPAECLQLIFAALDPTLIERKFRNFSKMVPNSPEAKDFVTLEDWSNNGPPLPAGVANEVFDHWYRDNLTAKGGWRIGDLPVQPENMHIPTLALIPRADRIVPPLSALALAYALKADIIRPDAGHVGMIVGSRAASQCWEPLSQWLRHAQVALCKNTA